MTLKPRILMMKEERERETRKQEGEEEEKGRVDSLHKQQPVRW